MPTSAERDARIVGSLDELAVDIGRLLRRISNGREVWTDLDVWTLERLAGHVENAYEVFQPTAAQIVAYTYPGDEGAITEALRIVDARTRALHVKLGLDAAAAMRVRAWREQLAEELAA